MTNDIRFIAFYLPQFHPIPENDEWWGKGFTEWRNVTKASPLFRNHYQPHIPSELGFYDLRLDETRQAQAVLAEEHGIEGFCYWHYWFNGKRLLERPFDEVIALGRPNRPFCLAWANENWSRRWFGKEALILQRQDYSDRDVVAHATWLARVFSDWRYITVNKRPLFVVYRPTGLPNASGTIETIKNISVKMGLQEPYILGADAHCPTMDLRNLGFDGTLRFAPQLGVLPYSNHDGRNLGKLRRNISFGIVSPKLKIYDYSDAWRLMQRELDETTYPTVFVSWDNSPRRGSDGIIMINSGPEKFYDILMDMVSKISKRPRQERIIFINAWNEWAEGNHLEPDLRHGRAYLDAVKSVHLGM